MDREPAMPRYVSPVLMLTSVIGAALFIGNLGGTIHANLNPPTDSPRIARLNAMLESDLRELPRGTAAVLVSSMAALNAPALAGVALLGLALARRRNPLPQREIGGAPWGLLEVFQVWGTSICVLAAGRFVLEVLAKIVGRVPEETVFGGTLVVQNVGMLALCVHVARSAGDEDFPGAAKQMENIRRNAIYGLKGFLVTAPFTFGATQLSQLIFGDAGKAMRFDALSAILLRAPAASVGILALGVVVLAPAAEETLFRGMLYPALERRTGRIAAIGLSGSIFAAMHLNLYNLCPLFVLGIGLAYTYARTRSLFACMVFHGLQNGLSMAAMLLMRAAAG